MANIELKIKTSKTTWYYVLMLFVKINTFVSWLNKDWFISFGFIGVKTIMYVKWGETGKDRVRMDFRTLEVAQ